MNSLFIEFSGTVFRTLLLNDSGETILKNESGLGFDINDEALTGKNPEELFRQFADTFPEIHQAANDEPVSAGILIGTNQTFLTVLPIDFNEDQSSIDSHILWELSNYFPETYKNYTVKYYRLNTSLIENIDEILIVAVNRGKIEFIKNLCNSINILIKSVEVDQFAVERCLKISGHAKLKDKISIILGCRNERLDFSLMQNEKLRYYDYETYTGTNFQIPLINQINYFDSAFGEIEEIFFYGEDSALSSIRNFMNEQFSKINTPVIGCGGINDPRFAPLYGLALKNQQT